MEIERWARAGLRLVPPAAAILLLPSLVRGLPPEPRAAPYLLGATVAAALWLARRRNALNRGGDALWAAAALWLAAAAAVWGALAAASEEPSAAVRRVESARQTVSRRLAREVHRLDSLMEQAIRRAQRRGEAHTPAERPWQQALADLRLRDSEGFALYDAEGQLLAWSGNSLAAPPDLLQSARLDSATYGAAKERDGIHLYSALRTPGEQVLVSERRIDPAAILELPSLWEPQPQSRLDFPLRPLERQAYEEFFSSFRPEHRPRRGGREPSLFFPLRAPNGVLLAVGHVRDQPARERLQAITGLWQDVGLLGLAALLLLWMRRCLVGFPALSSPGPLLAASLPVWLLRWLLGAAGSPHLRALRPLFDHSDYTSQLLGTWSRSPGDLLLTLGAALLQAALLYAAAGQLQRGVHYGRWRAIAGRVGLLLATLLGLGAIHILVCSVARDARSLLLGVDWQDLRAPVFVLQAALFAGAAALGLLLAATGRWACRSCAAWPRRRWLPDLDSGRRLLLTCLLGVVGVTLAYYPTLYYATEASRRALVRTHVLQQVLDQGSRRDVALREALKEVLQEPDLVNSLRAGPRGADPALAFRIWSHTELAALGLDSSLRLEDAEGRVVSRFGLNLPEAFERALAGTIVAGPGPTPARVRLASIEKPVLYARRTLTQGERPVGAVQIVVPQDYGNIPFVFSSNPYTLLFHSPAYVLARPSLLGAPPYLFVYREDSLDPVFSSDRSPPPPVPAQVLGRLDATQEPVWWSVPRGRQRLRLLYARHGGEVLAVGYQREGFVRLAADFLQLAAQNALLGALLALGAVLILAPGGTRRLRRLLRPDSATRTFYRRLLMTLLVASLIPLLALALFLEGMLAHEVRQEVQRIGSSALAVAGRVVADYQSAVQGGGGRVDDDLLYWVSQAIHQDIHIYRGAELAATSRRELFSSGLLPTRLRGEVYMDVVEERLPTSLRQERVGGQRFYVISGRLDLPALAEEDWVLSLPLGLKQEELEGKLRDVREATLLTTVILVMLLSLLTYFPAERIARPVRDLARAAARLAAGDLAVRVEHPAEAELQALIEAFNRMASAIRTQQDDLRARRDYIEKILLNATTGVVSFDSAGRVVTVNPAARLLTGAALEPGAGLRQALVAAGFSSLADLLPAPEASSPGSTGESARSGRRAASPAAVPFGAAPPSALARPAAPRGTGAERREELTHRSGDEERRVRVVLVPLREEERPSGGILLLEDITESVRSDRLRAWAEMAQRMAHEIKNPLTPIQLSAEHLRYVYRDRPAEFGRVLEECLGTITGQVRALRQIAREFSTYARIPELKLERADLRQVVEEALNPYLSSAPPGLRIERRWNDRPLAARVDRSLLQRALVNLLENSLEAVQGRGTIRVGIEELSANGRRRLRITVEDDGPGIDPAILPRLFEPFFSTKGSGTGLGLAIARQAVEASGGSIAVERPAAGRGTCMVILLPAADD